MSAVRPPENEPVVARKSALWPVALVILAIVFGPAAVAWGISLLVH